MGPKHSGAVSQWEQGRWHRGTVLADCWQTSHRGPITFPACQEGVNPRGVGQTLGSMVTECVINAAMCPVPRTFSTSGPFLRLWKRGRGQLEERGHPGPLYATASVQRGDIVSVGASGKWPLSAMKLWETTDWSPMTDVWKERAIHRPMIYTDFFPKLLMFGRKEI